MQIKKASVMVDLHFQRRRCWSNSLDRPRFLIAFGSTNWQIVDEKALVRPVVTSFFLTSSPTKERETNTVLNFQRWVNQIGPKGFLRIWERNEEGGELLKPRIYAHWNASCKRMKVFSRLLLSSPQQGFFKALSTANHDFLGTTKKRNATSMQPTHYYYITHNFNVNWWFWCPSHYAWLRADADSSRFFS